MISMNATPHEIVVRTPRAKPLLFQWVAENLNAPRIVRIRLAEESAEVNVRGIFFTRGNEELSIRLEVIHEAPRTKSNVMFRGLVADRGVARVHEIAVLKKGAKGAETHVEAKAMLLSDQAKAEIEPYLEIDEDDVRATHSASVRPLEEEEIFYLMSRGLSRKVAERMLLEAFLAPVAEALPQGFRGVKGGKGVLSPRQLL